MQTDPLAQIFKPAPSFGWAWLLGLVLLTVLPLGLLFSPGMFEGEDAVGAWITIAVMIPIAAYLLVTLLSIPAMRYEVGTEALVLRCGPLLHYRIPYSEITEVRRATLTPSMWSSMRLPGLALGGVVYADEGTLYMCATRMARDILLVSTAKKRYGITPEDEQQLVLVLTPKLPKPAPAASVEAETVPGAGA